MFQKTLVFCHATYQHTEFKGQGFEEIAFGKNEHSEFSLYGRVPTALKIAIAENAHTLHFSSDVRDTGWKYDAEGIARYVRGDISSYLLEIAGLPLQKTWFRRFDLRANLEAINTTNECEFVFRTLGSEFDRIIFVTSSWHVPRLSREAIAVADRFRVADLPVPDFYVAGTHGGSNGVTIFEPSHREPQTEMNVIAERYFGIEPEHRPAFEEEFKSLLGKYGA